MSSVVLSTNLDSFITSDFLIPKTEEVLLKIYTSLIIFLHNDNQENNEYCATNKVTSIGTQILFVAFKFAFGPKTLTLQTRLILRFEETRWILRFEEFEWRQITHFSFDISINPVAILVLITDRST